MTETSRKKSADREAGAWLWRSMTTMTIRRDEMSDLWQVIGRDGAVLAAFETGEAASRWAQGT